MGGFATLNQGGPLAIEVWHKQDGTVEVDLGPVVHPPSTKPC